MQESARVSRLGGWSAVRYLQAIHPHQPRPSISLVAAFARRPKIHRTLPQSNSEIVRACKSAKLSERCLSQHAEKCRRDARCHTAKQRDTAKQTCHAYQSHCSTSRHNKILIAYPNELLMSSSGSMQSSRVSQNISPTTHFNQTTIKFSGQGMVAS
jgi:hypothetical protein